MCRKLTSEELSEPDVTLRIPLEKWSALPEDIAELLRYFLVSDDITSLTARLPAYRWREIQAMTRRIAQ